MRTVPAAIKLRLITQLADCGLPVVEATSFVSAERIPQLADADAVMQGLERRAGVRYPVLVPNQRGLERAVAAGAREIAVFSAASDAFNRKNINCDIAESLARLRPVVQAARAQQLWVRGYVSCVLGCPYQGRVEVREVVRVTRALLDMGCEEVSLGDTIGVGTPHAAREMLNACAAEAPLSSLAVHFHDTYGLALAKVYACLEAGLRTVDASVAGLGGCPYAPGASGNLATEDLIYMLDGLGLATGVNLDRLAQVSLALHRAVKRPLASRYLQAYASSLSSKATRVLH